MLQSPLEQRPEQHCALVVQTFPDVVHLPPVPPSLAPPPMSPHLPPTQVSVQQGLVLEQAPPTDTHWFALQLPLTQAPLQQSVLTLQAAPARLFVPHAV